MGKLIEAITEIDNAFSRAECLLEAECKDGDRICESLGVERTEGGRLNVRSILSAIKRRQHGKGEGCWCIPTKIADGVFEHRCGNMFWVLERGSSPVEYLGWRPGPHGYEWQWVLDIAEACKWDERCDAVGYTDYHGGVAREHMNC